MTSAVHVASSVMIDCLSNDDVEEIRMVLDMFALRLALYSSLCTSRLYMYWSLLT